jgi:hypothetical protein
MFSSVASCSGSAPLLDSNAGKNFEAAAEKFSLPSSIMEISFAHCEGLMFTS